MDLENNYLTPNWVSRESARECCQAAKYLNTDICRLTLLFFKYFLKGRETWKYRRGTACFCVCNTSLLLTPAGWYFTGMRGAERGSVKTEPPSKQKNTRVERKESGMQWKWKMQGQRKSESDSVNTGWVTDKSLEHSFSGLHVFGWLAHNLNLLVYSAHSPQCHIQENWLW